MGIIAETSVYINSPGPNAAEGLATLRENQLAIRELNGALPPQDVTIVDGSISPTRSTIYVDTEGQAPADDLQVINPLGGETSSLHNGMILELLAKDASRVVTVKHSTGQNCISLTQQEDLVLSTTSVLRLQWDETTAVWRQRGYLPDAKINVATISEAGLVKPDGTTLTVTEDGTLSVLKQAAVPVGTIMLFSGLFGGTGNRFPIDQKTQEPVTSWCLCDGVVTNGINVPDLRDKFVVGAGSTYTEGDTGGASTHTHTVSGSVGATTLTTSQMPSHNHTYTTKSSTNGGGTNSSFWEGSSSAKTGSTGGSESHTHSLESVSVTTNSSLPPYYALSYIMCIM